MKLARALPVFSAVYLVVYLIAMYYNLALATYVPRTGTWYALTNTALPPRAGPGMYWYGWILTATLCGVIVSAIYLAVPARGDSRLWPRLAWAVPTCVILVIVFLLRTWFIR
jgi:hypothetical protein